MSDVTRILSAIEQGDPSAAEQLLPFVYDELRRLATRAVAREAPGHSLNATALVHEAYIRLVDVETAQVWNSRGHFLAAAATAMRRILIENARRRNRIKRGGNLQRIDLDTACVVAAVPPDELLALDETIDKLEAEDPSSAELVRTRFFTGCSIEDAGAAIGVSRATAYRQWTYARAWLRHEMDQDPSR